MNEKLAEKPEERRKCMLCPGDKRRTLFKIYIYFKERSPKHKIEKWYVCSKYMERDISRTNRPFRVLGKTTWRE